ncbi:MAG: hypothetical protein NTZ09_19965 [Candidatus Hydrogenedentes bacterium]|nr:hypothetical protein [Candidatus Hydrogenedentota bacterium]
MAIKGNSYTKTAWAFQERPVASFKLNLWDDRIEGALEIAYFLLNLAWGGGNGVLRGATEHDLQVTAKSPPGMIVQVNPGYAFISKNPYKLQAAEDSPAIGPPSVNPRIDLVQARLDTWSTTVKTGAESSSPSPPNPDADCIPVARLYLRPGMTCIVDTDDGVNGYIIDVRSFL